MINFVLCGQQNIFHRRGEGDGIANTQGVRTLLTFFGTQFNKACVVGSDFIDILYDGLVIINNFYDDKIKPIAPDAIVKRARAALPLEGYNVIYNNCEHFITDCRYGQPKSLQVHDVTIGVLVSFSLIAGAVFLLGLGIRKSTNDDNKEGDEQSK
ncbi:unnamed protein product [Didymodactylos carnosus]|uniref:LRAT domain-containing protein n=1 Tax=Didymodactylos carnosus TaxID=1234261 RepID=A0A8S2G1S6_9BILA|nr:unnamed protein product [Didymodactylos carnosus]CAF4428734.1 unnamed protein product [Didymodactylos carnosus]